MKRVQLAALVGIGALGLSGFSVAASARGSVPVPPQLRGRWAADSKPIIESCDPEFPDLFKYSFEADATRFVYWESRGKPTRVRQTAPGRYVIDLAMEGEGYTWTVRRTLMLTNHGRTLLSDEAIRHVHLSSRRYRRCPDRPAIKRDR